MANFKDLLSAKGAESGLLDEGLNGYVSVVEVSDGLSFGIAMENI